MIVVRIELGQLFVSLGWEASQLSRCLAWGVMVLEAVYWPGLGLRFQTFYG